MFNARSSLKRDRLNPRVPCAAFSRSLIDQEVNDCRINPNSCVLCGAVQSPLDARYHSLIEDVNEPKQYSNMLDRKD